MWFETSSYTWGRPDPDTVTEQRADPSQTCQTDLEQAEECASELDSLSGGEDYIWNDETFSWVDEDETSMSLLCTAHDPIPSPDGGMVWRSESGLQDVIMGEADTDTVVSTDIEMLDVSADPSYIDAEQSEEMDWEPCYCTDADNDIVMRDVP
ncbi:hypothetical protein MY5147_006050 [Beauveria neobassiana]|uniref:Uncharacterized protein n=1 Tax=Beauveria bassiana D1-5 TaxID=1245745 RepID=A0A0A2V9Z6_BEABA|nr:hypothetical protein BBAD15_g10092 [Beauveria bassiana D1-5]